LHTADRAGEPIVAVTDEPALPYVLTADLVRVPPGQGFPVEAIADALAARLGERGTALAARLPVLRPAVCRHLISQYSKKNALVATSRRGLRRAWRDAVRRRDALVVPRQGRRERR